MAAINRARLPENLRATRSKPLIREYPNHKSYPSRQTVSSWRKQETKGTEIPWSKTNKYQETIMKIVVIGGTGLMDRTWSTNFGEHGHEAVAAAPDTGVNTVTGEGLAEVLKGASVVVDVSNSPSYACGRS